MRESPRECGCASSAVRSTKRERKKEREKEREREWVAPERKTESE